MKKLMIALAAAAAITGVAKADIDNHVTTFESENLEVGAAFDATLDDEGTQTGAKYWAIEEGATEPYAIVTNADFNGSAPTNTSTKALTIDTDKLLSRKVKAGDAGAESFGEAPLYFDGYVQFTAADSLPETEAGDKLVVWLYGGDADTDAATATALGLENKVATNLVVTAGEIVEGILTTKQYVITNLGNDEAEIAPNSWHRLTIKAIVDNNIPKFKVFVDGKLAKAGADEVYTSMVANGAAAWNTLTSVSFKGTGAVDDLGFLNEAAAPEFAKDQEAETFTLAVSSSGTGTITDVKVNGDSYTEPITATVGATLTVVVESDDTVTCAQASSALVHDEDMGTWTFTVDTTGVAAESTLTLSIVATSGEGPSDWPADPREVAGTTAAGAFGIEGDLAAADAGALATWATAKGVNYADRTTAILTDAFLLNCDNTQAAIDKAKEDFKVTSISVAADGTVTITPADGAKYGNGKVVIEGSTALPAEWHTKTSTDHFFRVKLVVDEVQVN